MVLELHQTEPQILHQCFRLRRAPSDPLSHTHTLNTRYRLYAETSPRCRTEGETERYRHIAVIYEDIVIFVFKSGTGAQIRLHPVMVLDTVTLAFCHYLEVNCCSVQCLMSHRSCRQNSADRTKHNPETTG